MPADSPKPANSPKAAKRPGLAPASRYEILAPTTLPGMEMADARLLPLGLIDHNPYQARQVFDVEALQELAGSIQEHGVIEPIIVRPVEGRYEIVAGERRYRAAMLAEQELIPARIMEVSSKQAAIITALENLQREDLDIEDEARQFDYLCGALEVSQRELARMLGKNPVYISRRIRLLKRPDLMEEYRAGRLTLHQAAAQADPSPEDLATGGESDSLGITQGQTTALEEGEQIELVEREDLHGFIVTRSEVEDDYADGSDSPGITTSKSRGSSRSNGSNGSNKRPLFRWRPLQQFYNWVGRTQIADVPPDERATVRAQLTSIKEALEKQLEQLEQLEKGSKT